VNIFIPAGIESSIKQSVELLAFRLSSLSLYFFGFRNIAASAGLRVSALTAEIIIAIARVYTKLFIKKRPKIRK